MGRPYRDDPCCRRGLRKGLQCGVEGPPPALSQSLPEGERPEGVGFDAPAAVARGPLISIFSRWEKRQDHPAGPLSVSPGGREV